MTVSDIIEETLSVLLHYQTVSLDYLAPLAQDYLGDEDGYKEDMEYFNYEKIRVDDLIQRLTELAKEVSSCGQ